MPGVRLIVRVAPEKRREFLASARAIGTEPGNGVERAVVLKGHLDESLFCWAADFGEPSGRDAFVSSIEFLALKGAANVLGMTLDACTLDEQGAPPAAGGDPRTAVGAGPLGARGARPEWVVRVCVRVPPDQRRSFSGVAEALVRDATPAGTTWTFEGVDEPDLVCCMMDLAVPGPLNVLQSPSFVALEDAARTRGRLERVSIFRKRGLS